MSDPTPSETSWPRFARQVIARHLAGESLESLSVPDPDRAHSGAFVTLRRRERLRGCVGTLDGSLSVTAAVSNAAIASATNDARFPPVSAGELAELRVEVSILTSPRTIERVEEIELGRHGVVVRTATARGVFLPKVAVEFGWDVETLLSRCCTEKAGLSADAWKHSGTEILVFTSDVYSE